MKKEFYQNLHDYVLSHEGLKKMVELGTKFLPGIVYVSYPLMLLCLLLIKSGLLLRSVVVPLAGFLICTVLRAGINAPRPYEKLGIPAITKKDTHGKSFPSRHAACGSVIAFTTLWAAPLLGIFLLVVSVLIVFSRVLSGVHFIRDVVTGWLLGAVIGLIGMLI